MGLAPRYLVTSLQREPQGLYEQDYCARGEAENRIKEQQLDLFSDRTTCHEWWPNQFRLLLSSFAYVLLETLRRIGLAATELARAQAGTIRREAAENRGSGGAQQPPGAAVVFIGLSLARGLPPLRGLLLRLSPCGAGPGTR
jgi:hypothetical protein